MIFPREIIEFTSESNFARNSVPAGLIYMIVTVAASVLLALLPVIHVDVGVRGRGILKPSVERAELQSMVAGIVRELHVKENSRVGTGDIIAVLDADELNETIRFREQRVQLLEQHLDDLNLLLTTDTLVTTDLPDVKTTRFRRSLNEFELRLINAAEEAERIGREFNRKEALFNRAMISREQYESSRQMFREASRNQEILIEQQVNRWSDQQLDTQSEVVRIYSELEKSRQELTYYTIRAPVGGTVQNLARIHPGSVIFPQQFLGEINPDTMLVAEIFVKPADVGLIREGMPVRFQVDAFDAHQWGVISGNVTRVSNDATMMDGIPVFIIRCSVDRTFLELSNGYRGNLRKGMTLQSRFLVANRSLFQLIYDNLNDWLNPAWSETDDT